MVGLKKKTSRRLHKFKSFKPRLEQMKPGDNLVFKYSDRFSVNVSMTKDGYFISPASTDEGLFVRAPRDVETAIGIFVACFVEGARSNEAVETLSKERKNVVRDKTRYIL